LVGSGLEAAVWSFGSGLFMLTIVLLVNQRMRVGVKKVVWGLRNHDFPRWYILGGILGGTIVGVQASVVPLVGVALFTVAAVAGQSEPLGFSCRLHVCDIAGWGVRVAA